MEAHVPTRELGSGVAREGATAALLERAQLVADELRRDAEADAAALTTEARRLEAEARRLHDDAAAVHAAAERTRTEIARQLAEAADEARSIVTDAGEQASLLLTSAG